MAGRRSDPPLGLTDLRAAVPHRSVHAPRVSRWSVGMHVHHCCLTVQAIHGALSRSRPPAPRTWRSLLGRLVLWRGRIPRGRARATKAVLPDADLSPERLHADLTAAEQTLEAMSQLDPQSWFGHFALGALRRDDAVRFVHVHTNHHLAIIRDILTATGTRQWEVLGEPEPESA